MYVRVIIPAFNEATPLAVLLEQIPHELNGNTIVPLVVSDGSTDKTVSVARAAGIEVLDLKENSGKGTAVIAGLSLVEDGVADAVVIMDADGQHSPDDLADLIAPLANGSADVAVGSRYARGESRGSAPLNRYAVRWATVRLLERILGSRFSDPYCGYRAFTREALQSVEFCGSRYEGELEILFDATRCGLRVVEVPVEKIYNKGGSKMSADGGKLLGRLRVIRQYASTILSKRRELVSSPPAKIPMEPVT